MAAVRLGLFAFLLLAACRTRATAPPVQAPPAPVIPAPAPAPVPPAPAAPAAAVLLYVKIPEPLMPIARGQKYEGPIDELLRGKQLGEVTGGGTMLSRAKKIEYVGLDLKVTDVAAALPLLQAKLRELGAPRGTVIEESRADAPTIEHPLE
jgi:hypothetical protein